MPTYKIDWTREVWYRSEIEAESFEEAREKFWIGDYDDDKDEIFGSEVQENIDIEEVTNA